MQGLILYNIIIKIFAWRDQGQGFDLGRSFNLNLDSYFMQIKFSDLSFSHVFH